MRWQKLTLKTTTGAVELVSNMLSDLGIDGIEIEDKIPLSEDDKNTMFINDVDILPKLDEDDGIADISFYVEEDRDLEELLNQIEDGLSDLEQFVSIGSGTISVSDTEDKDWINNWKEFFKPFRIDETIVIKPTWETLDQVHADDLVIEIDPGTAFGTGSHETTKLAILNLKKYIKPGSNLLDVGCGSGILSIIGRKLGAGYVAGVDVDANAVKTSVENVLVNKLVATEYIGTKHLKREPDRMDFVTGNVIDSRALREQIGIGCYDIIVANILADIIIPLSGVISEQLKPGGLFISSGIINTKKMVVEAALLQNGYEIIEITEMGDWVSIVAAHD